MASNRRAGIGLLAPPDTHAPEPGATFPGTKDPLDHCRFGNGRNDQDLPTAVRAVVEIDLRDPLEQTGHSEIPYS